MIDHNISRMVIEAAEAAARRTQNVDVESLWLRFIQAATSPAFKQRLPVARSHRWAGAIPTWEHPGAVVQPMGKPLGKVIGIDGSQIYPQERQPVQWLYVQAVAYQVGMPTVMTSQFADVGTLLLENGEISEDLHESQDELAALTNTWRTLLEMRLASEIARDRPDSLLLLDNGLLPWLSVSGQAAVRNLQQYLGWLQEISPSPIAGVISGPQSRLLERVVHLAEADNLADGLADKREFLDQSVMLHVLQPGERSALFLHGSPRNDRFQEVGAGVYFFFLRTSAHELSRVEIPEWMARDAELVARLHTTILRDACVDGYSYVLSQAHQHAVIPYDVAQSIQEMAQRCFVQSGGLVRKSAKIAMKAA